MARGIASRRGVLCGAVSGREDEEEDEDEDEDKICEMNGCMRLWSNRYCLLRMRALIPQRVNPAVSFTAYRVRSLVFLKKIIYICFHLSSAI
jgi:hypothetical protein